MSHLLPATEEHLKHLIACPTVSSESNLAMMAMMGDYLEHLGAKVELFRDATGTKANMFATLGPDIPGGVVLSGHSDVVPVTDQDWSSDPFALVARDDHLYGRGTCDMKGFIAAALALAEPVSKMTLRRPLHLCFTHDEEVGCLGARALVPELQRRGYAPRMAIIGEPTGMRLIEGHKGCCEYTTRFSGLEGHGSAPDRGVNAVLYALRYTQRLMEMAEALKARAPRSSRFDPPWTTVNVGRLSGGAAHNVIPGKAEIDWEMRPVQPGDAEFVKEALAHCIEHELLPAMRAIHPEAAITTEVIGEVAGLMPMEDNDARDLISRLTGINAADVVPFGTEAGLFQQMGLSVVVCGPGEIAQAHKPDEFVTRGQLAQCLGLLEGIAHSLAA
ncbi:acetylornithine deacetylase [Yangia mangrovi]|uniref:Acetylornithine deacetylase n=2 Tax=Alloyangia mangrovi TaxID=1779329 RepID=A0ABT2KNV9_9RHOB|nr:acetylornithine deacetylase [Alloyangia mangrovi]MCA0939059.1 acetylornithine deacetylase [Alloyangia pacifica]MCA0944776.1 acetylornithine deacetylase [Alloyangia pacifica]MCT4371158.1 acetylornithine deacetylase [Alloyangia mangrovi]